MEQLDFVNKSVRAAAILTSSYVAGTVIENAQKFNQLVLNLAFTVGSLTDAQIKVEASVDGTNYYQVQEEVNTAGVITFVPLIYKLTATSSVVTKPVSINAKYIKISAIGTGTATSSSLAVNAILRKN